MHTKVADASTVRRARRCGLDAVVYAPHFTQLPRIETRAAALSTESLAVIPAREIFTGNWRSRRHVLAIGLSEPVPDFIPLADALEELERQGAAILVPHPTFFTVSLTVAEVHAYGDVIDAVECYNPKLLPHHTRRAYRLAEDVGLPVFASSYAHLRGTVGHAWTSFPEQIEDEEDLCEVLRKGALGTVGAEGGLGHLGRRMLEFSHLGWENSAKKAHRVVGRQRAATHPDDPLYGDRFVIDGS